MMLASPFEKIVLQGHAPLIIRGLGQDFRVSKPPPGSCTKLSVEKPTRTRICCIIYTKMHKI